MRNLQSIISVVLLCLLLCGCFGPSYETLKPSQSREYTKELLGTAPPEMWFWPRGRIIGDLDLVKVENGDLQEEEVVLVRLQAGSHEEPAPSSEVWLRVFHRNPDTNILSPVTAKKIYTLGNVPENFILPEEVLSKWTDGPVENENLVLADLDEDGKPEILVSLMHPLTSGKTAAIHSIYSMDNNELVLKFGCLAMQSGGSLFILDLNEDGKQELVIPAVILPPHGAEVLHQRPEWPCIYSQVKPGAQYYQQNNDDFSEYYNQTLEDLYADMLQDILAGRKETFNQQCCYLGLIYSYRKDFSRAEQLLRPVAEAPGELGKLARQKLAKIQGKATEGDSETQPDR
ncbi:MAG: hypothetical protein JXA52_07335 [Planctomycetes bacterium]|nr:hypothetical protein [Planctomycetota bacterium]